MQQGRVVEVASREQLLSAPQHAATRTLLNAALPLAGR